MRIILDRTQLPHIARSGQHKGFVWYIREYDTRLKDDEYLARCHVLIPRGHPVYGMTNDDLCATCMPPNVWHDEQQIAISHSITLDDSWLLLSDVYRARAIHSFYNDWRAAAAHIAIERCYAMCDAAYTEGTSRRERENAN